MALKEPVPRFDAGSDRERTKKEGEEEGKKKKRASEKLRRAGRAVLLQNEVSPVRSGAHQLNRGSGLTKRFDGRGTSGLSH